MSGCTPAKARIRPSMTPTSRSKEIRRDRGRLLSSPTAGTPTVGPRPDLRLGTAIESFPVWRSHSILEFVPRDGISSFIHNHNYNPWFEPISTGDFAASYETEVTQAISPGYRYIEFGPHWFGNSSTWGVLADGVTKILRDAQFPGVKNHPLLR